MKPTVLIEALDLSEATFEADDRLLRNVVLIRAGMSLNRRHYSEAVLQKAVPIFEGARAYDSHKRGERGVGELTGWYANVHYQEGALRADRHFTRTDAGRNVLAVVEDILSGKAPKNFAGLSINAVGTGKPAKFDDGDGLDIESITAAHSVDDVVEPAAGGTYLAASSGDEMTRALLAAMTFEEWVEIRPDYLKRVTKELRNMRESDAVKAAQAVAADLDARLSEAQVTIAGLEAEREAAVVEAQRARRALLIETELQKVNLPVDWKTGLRDDLMEADPATWPALLQLEVKKARSAGHKPRVDVTGAGVQIAPAPTVVAVESVVPRDDEDVEAWRRRTQQR